MIIQNHFSRTVLFECSNCKEEVTTDNIIKCVSEIDTIHDSYFIDVDKDNYPTDVVSFLKLINSKLEKQEFNELISLYQQLKP